MTNAICGWDISFPAEGVEKDDIIMFADQHFKRWAFQKEKGSKTGHIHFQFRGSLKVKLRKTSILKLLRGSEFNLSEKCVLPTSNEAFFFDDVRYVVKEETRIEGPWSSEDEGGYIPTDMRFEPEWRPMQSWVLERMKEKPNRRTIYCIVDPVGNNGKSFLATWLFTHGLANYVPFFTEAKDLMRMVFGMKRKDAYFIDLPRALSHRAEHEIYGGIEQLKTGIIYEDRYKFRMEAIDPVHVFVFTNRIPNMELASSDRWFILDCASGERILNLSQKAD